MSFSDPPKHIRRLVRQYAEVAHEAELRLALKPLAEAFEQWSRGELDSFTLSDRIHDFHQGPARALWHQYTGSVLSLSLALTAAIATGVLDREQLPPELLEHLSPVLSAGSGESGDRADR